MSPLLTAAGDVLIVESSETAKTIERSVRPDGIVTAAHGRAHALATGS